MPELALPLMAVAAIGGLGLQTYGTVQSSQAQSRLAQDQQRQEALRMQAMELDAKRRRMEAIRQGQRARALALTNATAQGAGFGTGLLGGYGQIQGSEDRNLLGISQGLDLGRANFALNQSITSDRSSIAMGSGLASLGGSLVSSLGPLERLSYGFGSGASRPAPISIAVQ